MGATERWDAFLAQIEERHRAVREEAAQAAGAAITTAAAPTGAALSQAWSAVESRLQELERRIMDTWHEKVDQVFSAEGVDDRQHVDRVIVVRFLPAGGVQVFARLVVVARIDGQRGRVHALLGIARRRFRRSRLPRAHVEVQPDALVKLLFLRIAGDHRPQQGGGALVLAPLQRLQALLVQRNGLEVPGARGRRRGRCRLRRWNRDPALRRRSPGRPARHRFCWFLRDPAGWNPPPLRHAASRRCTNVGSR